MVHGLKFPSRRVYIGCNSGFPGEEQEFLNSGLLAFVPIMINTFNFR